MSNLNDAAHVATMSKNAAKLFAAETEKKNVHKVRGAKQQCEGMAITPNTADLFKAAAAAIEAKAIAVLKGAFADAEKLKRYAGVAIGPQTVKSLQKQLTQVAKMSDDFTTIWAQIGADAPLKRQVTPTNEIKVFGSVSYYHAAKLDGDKYVKITPSNIAEVLRAATAAIAPAKKEAAKVAKALAATRKEREDARAILALDFDGWKAAKVASEPALVAALEKIPNALEGVFESEHAAAQKRLDDLKAKATEA